MKQLQPLVVILLLTASSLAALAQSVLPEGYDPQSRARLPYLNADEVDTAGQRVWQIFGASGSLNGPLAFAAYNPEVADALLNLHDASVGAASLNAHDRELAIMVACRETNYNLEWNAHAASALRAGVSEDVLNIVRTGGSISGLEEKDAAIIRLGRQLYADRKVDQETFNKVVELWGERGAMDMVAVMNTYAVSGFFAIAVDERPQAGETPLPDLR